MTVQQALGVPACIRAAALAPVATQAPEIGLPAATACDFKPGNLVNSGIESLKSAFSTKFADQRSKDMKAAERVLLQAVTGEQGKNAAAWYYLARYYVMAGDRGGADSALVKVLALAPACQEN